MKAIVVASYGGPEVLKVAQIAIPAVGDDQVLIKVAAIGVNPVETYIRSGAYATAPKPPFTPGNDCAGIVESVGSAVTQFKVGDRVYTKGSASGTYAEKTVCDERCVHALPANVSFAQGAAIGIPYSTAYFALFCSGDVRASQRVFIHGATGGVGLAAVQLARAHGCTVIGSAGTDEGAQLVLAQGAHQVVNHSHSSSGGGDDKGDYLAKVGPVDLIIENLANVNLARDLTILNQRGTVVVVGNRGEITINPRLLMRGNLTVKGILGPNATQEESDRAFAAIHAGLESGTLKPVIDTEYSLEDAPQAHTDIMTKRHYGKLVLLTDQQ